MAVALYTSLLALFVASLKGFVFSGSLAFTIIGIAVITTITIFVLIFILAVVGGLFIYHRKADPNNFLIPMTTSIADFGSLIVLSYLTLVLL